MKMLVTFRKNWADEFDAYGLALLSQSHCELLRKSIYDLWFNFGTNEGWESGEFENSDFHFRLVGDKEEAILKMLIPFVDLGDWSYWGNFPDLDEILYDEEGNLK